MNPGTWIIVALIVSIAALSLTCLSLARTISSLTRNKVVRIEIHRGDRPMSGPTIPVTEGATAPFIVVGFNKAGRQVPLTDPAAVTTGDPTIATATVNPDGTNGVATGVGPGSTPLNATSGTLTADPATLVVSQDLAVASIAIQVPTVTPPSP
jgi:hypothetical protein